MSSDRRRVAALALVALVALSGCAGFGSVTSEEGLAEDASYDWDTDADATITFDEDDDEYRAVYTIENRSTVRVYQSTRYGNDQPIGIRAVQFRYPNGTVVGTEEIEVDETRSEVYVHLPAETGQLAYTTGSHSKNFQTQAFVEGSYEVILPPGHRVENFVLATVRPSGHETELDGETDRVHIRWDEVSSGTSISVRYYLERDLYLFGGLVVIASAGALIGMAYVYRQIKRLQERREEMGLDVDVDDDRRRPPPGMR